MGEPARGRRDRPAGKVSSVGQAKVPCPAALRGEQHALHRWPAAGDLTDPAACVWATCTGEPPTQVELAAVALNQALTHAKAAVLPAICAQFGVSPAEIQAEFRRRAIEELGSDRDPGPDGV